jgi:hypothetical protein
MRTWNEGPLQSLRHRLGDNIKVDSILKILRGPMSPSQGYGLCEHGNET